MADKKKQLYWMGHPVRDEEHARSLDMKAAVNQFHHGMTRDEAESRAKDEDRRERHAQAAAHHLSGLRAADAAGDKEGAQKHHAFYSLHVRKLGLDPSGPVPREVQVGMSREDHKPAYSFRQHPDDQFLTHPDGIKKSEPAGHAGAALDENLKLVRSEEWPHVLSLWANLAKDDGSQGAQRSVKQFDPKRTWLRSKRQPEEHAHDYSAWLTRAQRGFGYRMFVLSNGPGNPVRVHVTHGGRRVGLTAGNVDQGDLEVENYYVAPQVEHQGKGLEAAMLNAMLGHARSRMGADYLSHRAFTPESAALIDAVARPHGYELGEAEDVGDEPLADQKPGQAPTGGVRVRGREGSRHAARNQALPAGTGWWRTASEEFD